MSKKIHEFNDIIRKLRKELFGKGPERIHTVFVDNMAVSTLYGN
ncbi:Na-translocating system protein MpsC family protein, partial [Salinicoccus roseus]